MDDLINIKDEQVLVKCASCEKSLMHYFVVGTKEKETRLQATCPFCNGASEVITVAGRIFGAPLDKTEFSVPTVIENIVFEDILTFLIAKAKG